MKTMRIQFDDRLHKKLSLYAAMKSKKKQQVILEGVEEKVDGIGERTHPMLGLESLRGRLKGIKVTDKDIQKVRRGWERI